MRRFACGAVALGAVVIVMAGCERVPDFVIADIDGGAPPTSLDGTSSTDGSVTVSDAATVIAPDAAPAEDANPPIDSGTGPCPAAAPPGAQCCGSILCRGKGADCDPSNCDDKCQGCTAVCCLRNNGDFQACAATVQACPPG